MGWTGNHATYYSNGTVDRKRECDGYFMEGLNKGQYKVLRSQMVGTVYYAAVTTIDDEDCVWAAIFLTSVNNKDYFNFRYKYMDETYGPSEAKCPKSILKILTTTNDEYASDWRRRCILFHEEKSNPNKLNNLPVGTVIQFNNNDKIISLVKHSPAYQFKRSFWLCIDTGRYISAKYIPKEYKITPSFDN